ncbi:hypothetical protein DEA8626_03425 [Defluviimonas aquaemixtae]|uniref:Excalibur calcium-binding domain-containing protein n=1 Tax=Albidovulum aquaemixtae TaxID=1542388 RepID=A0A2R8BLS0_9RHOB|nr:excalibur calcium-binding domain-containing protein [Defluviimonas aquaemixtae]SPH24374.1 hypothetical protein DEA8626_03425 [Defluviimonas aquaemixtae]
MLSGYCVRMAIRRDIEGRETARSGTRRRRSMAGFLASAIVKLCAIPIVAASVSVSLYIRTSPYRPTEALIHLVAMAGCPAAAAIGIPEAREGEPGYHARNDPDGDGVACGAARGDPLPGATVRDSTRQVGGAKFVRPKPAGGG